MATYKKQIRVYLWKHLRIFWAKKSWAIFLIAAVISLAVSYVQNADMFKYNLQTREGITVLISASVWIGLFNSVQVICKERETIKHEHRTGIHMSSYFLSHMIFQAGICFIEAIILLAISGFYLDYPSTTLFLNIKLEFFVTYFLTIYAADILGLMLSAIVKTTDAAMTIMPFLLIFELIFSGIFFTVDGPVEKLSAITICKYSMTASCISADYNSLEDAEKIMVSKKIYNILESRELNISYDNVKQLIDENYEVPANDLYNYSLINLVRQWGMLIAHTIVTALIGILSLEFIDKDKR